MPKFPMVVKEDPPLLLPSPSLPGRPSQDRLGPMVASSFMSRPQGMPPTMVGPPRFPPIPTPLSSSHPPGPVLIHQEALWETQDPPRRRPGRKPKYHTVEERRAQNREAQRQFRAKKEQRILDLEAQVDELKAMVRHLQEDNASLTQTNVHLSTLLTSRAPTITTAPTVVSTVATASEVASTTSSVMASSPSSLPHSPFSPVVQLDEVAQIKEEMPLDFSHDDYYSSDSLGHYASPPPYP
ncbi:hypothetical protein BJ684DRAFT_15965 [Piptocephalis cylindrospora]|uniref:BZIP domain-containing protein n=1 Tax=Piptocephalis cylindrospora TaxID=1907219 RepID=A0A4P9Y4H6_9FUNG|nr:hypothetical protein BJ684DRAFT_15965 [Piptocephalis cylindrospora]|eukprot:RKP13664.1 hypothetical protein BJ684DRAFT_15965 [Piptocephalis cylindrospora]